VLERLLKEIRQARKGTSQTGHSRQANESGFTLMELLIVMAVILILLAFAIPNLIGVKKHANEVSARNSLKAINTAEIQYSSTYPAEGFACNLAALGGSVGETQNAQSAHMLSPDLATGQKDGYTFTISNCSKVSVNGKDQFTTYSVTAVPQTVGKTGDKGFCTDESGEVRMDPQGGTACTTAAK
jgi:type IV pilus assembly protein PilA